MALTLLTVVAAAGCGGVSTSSTQATPRAVTTPPATDVSATTVLPRCPAGGSAGFRTSAGWTEVRVWSHAAGSNGCHSWLHLVNPSGRTATVAITDPAAGSTELEFPASLTGVTELSGEPVIVVVAAHGAANEFPQLFTVVDGDLRQIGVPATPEGLTWGGSADLPATVGCNRLGALVESGAGWTGSGWEVGQAWLVLAGTRLQVVGTRQVMTNDSGVGPPGAEFRRPAFAGCPHLAGFRHV